HERRHADGDAMPGGHKAERPAKRGAGAAGNAQRRGLFWRGGGNVRDHGMRKIATAAPCTISKSWELGFAEREVLMMPRRQPSLALEPHTGPAGEPLGN